MAKLELIRLNIFGQYVAVPKYLHRLGCIAFIAGYSDAFTFLQFNFFSTMMTGNFVLLFVAVHDHNWYIAYNNLFCLVCYIILGTLVHVFIMRHYEIW
jgi:uncharacterized membrane protein YoaK (UPF0700 family)